MMRITAGTLIGAGWEVLQRRWRLSALAGLLVALVQAGQRVLDGYTTNQPLTQALPQLLLITLLGALLQNVILAAVIRQMLLREGLVDPNVPPRYGAFVLINLLIVLAVWLGLVLLVVPGVLLLLRWFIAPPFTFSRGLGVMEALAASREATDGHRGAMLGALLVLIAVWLVPYVLLMVGVGVLAFNTAPVFGGVGLARLALSGLGGSLSLAFGTGVFRTLVHGKDALAEVFA
jgi:hypothetical protein